MQKVAFTWPESGLLDRITHAIGTRLAHAFGFSRQKSVNFTLEEALESSKLAPGRWVVSLPQCEAYYDVFPTRGMARGDLKKILSREVQNLSPLASEKTCLLPARFKAGMPSHALLTVRETTLTELVEKADALGASELNFVSEAAPDAIFETPDSLIRSRRERSIRLIAWMCLIGALWIACEIFASVQSSQIDALSAQEQQLRKSLTTRLAASEELTTLGEIAALQPQNRTATGRLETLAKLTHASPSHAHFIRLSINDNTIEIAGISSDPSDLLVKLSEDFSDYAVRFTRPISDTNSGNQSFVVELKQREDR